MPTKSSLRSSASAAALPPLLQGAAAVARLAQLAVDDASYAAVLASGALDKKVRVYDLETNLQEASGRGGLLQRPAMLIGSWHLTHATVDRSRQAKPRTVRCRRDW